MTPSRGPTRDASREDWRDYIANGHELLASARETLALHDGDQRAKSVALGAVHAAIAFADALTVAKLGLRNREKHAALPRLVEQAAGRNVDASQVKRLQQILDLKNEADYGARRWRRAEAEKLLDKADRFAAWVRDLLR